jgi:putative ABC transport system ATP-binding protein
MQPVLRCVNLGKEYRNGGLKVVALDRVNLEIMPGEFTAVVGPSGSGKSTLLHLMGGLDRPTSGQVWVRDRSLGELNPTQLAQLRLRQIGFIFQSYNLIPVLTALENAALVLELQGVGRSERERRAREALAELGVADLSQRRPNQLSGGQQQRVAVARAIVGQPEVVLADEPTANLDSKTGLALIDHMKHLNQVHGMTFVFSTHDPRLLEHVRRVIHLEDGRVVADEGAGQKL